MYRLYNRYNGDHMFTLSQSEYGNLQHAGWTAEGTAWYAPKKGETVYRLYNHYSGEHLFTANESEYYSLGRIGWTREGEGFRSGGTKPIYRLYNKWLKAGTHIYTTSKSEYDRLGKIGWKQEGVAFYSDDPTAIKGTWTGSLTRAEKNSYNKPGKCYGGEAKPPVLTVKSYDPTTGKMTADLKVCYHGHSGLANDAKSTSGDDYLVLNDIVMTMNNGKFTYKVDTGDYSSKYVKDSYCEITFTYSAVSGTPRLTAEVESYDIKLDRYHNGSWSDQKDYYDFTKR